MLPYIEIGIILFNTLIFSWVILEIVISITKKDNIYPVRSTYHHLLKFITSNTLAKILYPVFLYAYIYVYEMLGGNVNYSDVSTIVEFLFLLLLVDLIYYIAHYLHHKVKQLSSIHFVHHSGRDFNLTLAWRLAWLQKLYYPLFYIPLIIVGFNPFEVMLAVFLNTTYQATSHSAYIRLPRFFDYVFVTPHNHRIHHDQAVVNQNSNFGGIFSIWDRLFGTYVSDIKEFTPGIKGYSQDNFIMMEVDPIVKLIRQIKDTIHRKELI